MSNKSILQEKNLQLEENNKELDKLYSQIKSKFPNGKMTITENGTSACEYVAIS